MKRWTRCLALLMVCSVMLSACDQAQAAKGAARWTPDNEIISYEPIDTSKAVITLGEYVGIETKLIAEAIEAKFPTVDIVIMKNAAGMLPDSYLRIQAEQNALPDIIFSGFMHGTSDLLYDLSGESFVSRYHLTALNSVSEDGKLYQIPCADTAQGIWYNKTLFEEHGWAVPQTREEFYTLCDEISREGIRAFAPNLKYTGILHNLIFGLAHDETFSNVDSIKRLNAYTQGEIPGDGVIEPALGVLQDLYSRGIIVESDFASSITKTRQAMYAGEVAMIPYSLDMDYFYREEKPNCEIGFFGFPSDVPGSRWLRMVTGSTISLSKRSMDDESKKEILLDIFDYLSTPEGQEVITESLSGVSNVNGYSSRIAKTYPEIEACLQKGNVYYMNEYGTDDFAESYRQLVVGETTVAECVQTLNAEAKNNKAKDSLPAPPIGTATETFTVLETGIFIADTMRKATDAQIALIPNLSYFKGNLAQIFAGEITLPQRFYIKGLGAEDCLTNYQITGQNLKLLLEHPIINGSESNILYAFAGLKMEYAPWAPIGENVRKLTLADGTPIEDNATYTVAAWKTSIDERYISGIAKEFPELGNNIELMKTAIAAAGSIAPAKDGRITLVWDTAE